MVMCSFPLVLFERVIIITGYRLMNTFLVAGALLLMSGSALRMQAEQAMMYGDAYKAITVIGFEEKCSWSVEVPSHKKPKDAAASSWFCTTLLDLKKKLHRRKSFYYE